MSRVLSFLREKPKRTAYIGALAIFAAVSILAGSVHLIDIREKMSRIVFDSFYVTRPDGIGKVKITDPKGSALLFVGSKEAAGVSVQDYYPFDTDGLTLPKDAVQVGRRIYEKTETGMNRITVRLSGKDDKGTETVTTHVFLTAGYDAKVYDFYEADGTAPEGSALSLSESIRWERRPPTLAEGWKTAKVKMAQVKKDQKAASEGEQPKSLNWYYAAEPYLPSILGCSATDLFAGVTGSTFSQETHRTESYTMTYIRKDNQAVDITITQPLVQDETGVWAANAYRVYPPDSLSPELKSPTFDDIRSNTSYNIFVYVDNMIDHREVDYKKIDAFYNAVRAGKPGQVDLIVGYLNEGKLTIQQWFRLTYDGKKGIQYPFYRSYDGKWRYYTPREFTDITYYLSSTGSKVISYYIETEDQNNPLNVVFYCSTVAE